MRRIFPLILFVATLSFAVGIVLPLMSIERLLLFTDEPSLIGLIAGLWSGGDYALAAVICLFSVVFPATKLALLHMAAYGPPDRAALPAWLKGLANWSMLDVVLVALVIFAAKTSGLATAVTKPGLWFFALSAVLTAVASGVARRPDGPA